jgi:superfamily II DNA or RNA helicase
MAARLLPTDSLVVAPLPLLSPVVLSVKIEGDAENANLLFSNSVLLRWEIHPAILKAANEIGATTKFDAITATRKQLRELCKITPVAEPLGVANIGMAPKTLKDAKDRIRARGLPVLPSRNTSLAVTLHRGYTVLTPWQPFAVPAKAIDLSTAQSLLAKARTCGVPVIDLNHARSFFRLTEKTLIALATPGAPGWARLAGNTSGLQDPVTVMASAANPSYLTAVHPNVVEAAEVALAGPAGRTGLYPWQDRSVSVLRAASRGAVLALPPGSGKTIVSLVALSELLTPNQIAIVAVPSAIKSQWVEAAARFAPHLSCNILYNSKAVTEEVRNHLSLGYSTLNPPKLFVVSHDTLSGLLDEPFFANATQPQPVFSVMICDEAHVLGGSSKRAAALRMLRDWSNRGWALTGTPEEGGEKRLAAVSSWALAESFQAGKMPLKKRLGSYLVTFDVPTPCSISASRVPVTNSSQTAKEIGEIFFGNTSTAFKARNAFEKMRRDASYEKLLWLKEELASQVTPTLIFTDTIGVSNKVLEISEQIGLRAATLAGVLPIARTANAAAFVRGELDVLVCSSASQRGLDLQQARRVICLDIPSSSSVLAQRAARAVRIGGPSSVELLLPYLKGTAEEKFAKMLDKALADISLYKVPIPLSLDTVKSVSKAVS